MKLFRVSLVQHVDRMDTRGSVSVGAVRSGSPGSDFAYAGDVRQLRARKPITAEPVH